MKTATTPGTEREHLEIGIAHVNDALLGFTLEFRRRILTEAMRRIPASMAAAEEAEMDAQLDVLCGRRAGMIGTMRIPEDLR